MVERVLRDKIVISKRFIYRDLSMQMKNNTEIEYAEKKYNHMRVRTDE